MRVHCLAFLWLIYLALPNKSHSTHGDLPHLGEKTQQVTLEKNCGHHLGILGVLSPSPREETKTIGDPADFINRAIAANNEVWAKQFEEIGKRYHPPNVENFRTSVLLPGGQLVNASIGPFYYTVDQTIYLPEEFWNFMKDTLRTDAQAARAYVIAHETAHHVQNLLGYTLISNSNLAKATSESAKNQITTRVELHADYLAGRWARSVYGPNQLFSRNEVADVVKFVSKVGDDEIARLLERPFFVDNSTHGTSAKRKEAFAAGFRNHTAFERTVIPEGTTPLFR